jgi:hypothetical protein
MKLRTTKASGKMKAPKEKRNRKKRDAKWYKRLAPQNPKITLITEFSTLGGKGVVGGDF